MAAARSVAAPSGRFASSDSMPVGDDSAGEAPQADFVAIAQVLDHGLGNPAGLLVTGPLLRAIADVHAGRGVDQHGKQRLARRRRHAVHPGWIEQDGQRHRHGVLIRVRMAPRLRPGMRPRLASAIGGQQSRRGKCQRHPQGKRNIRVEGEHNRFQSASNRGYRCPKVGFGTLAEAPPGSRPWRRLRLSHERVNDYSYSVLRRWQACRVEDFDSHAFDSPPRGVQNRDADILPDQILARPDQAVLPAMADRTSRTRAPSCLLFQV